LLDEMRLDKEQESLFGEAKQEAGDEALLEDESAAKTE